MTDFFANLERELSAAAERPPRRVAGWPTAARRGLGAAVALVALAAALVPALVILGSGDERITEGEKNPEAPAVGTVIRKGDGLPPRTEDSTVLATGRTKIAGPWQIESYRGAGLKDPKTGEEYEPAGLRCLQIVLTDPPARAAAAGGQCGEFPKTPGFSRVQMTVPSRQAGKPIDPKTTEILVYGRVPEENLGVYLKVPGRLPERYETFEGPAGGEGDYYLIAVPPDLKDARVGWIAPGGRGGGSSLALLPP